MQAFEKKPGDVAGVGWSDGMKAAVTPAWAEPEMEQGVVRRWTDAIQEDDANTVREVYLSSSEAARQVLLYDQLPALPLEPCGHGGGSEGCGACYLRLPPLIHNLSLSLAVAAKAKKVLLFLFSQKAELEEGTWVSPYCYLVHSIVYSAHLMPCEEGEYVELFKWVKDEVSEEDLVRLLKTENCEGLYPLELAAQLDRFELFEAILNTDNVYVKCRIRQPLLCYTWYDVTDYEHPRAERRDKSPLLFFSQTDKEKLSEQSVRRFLRSPLVTKWFNAKFVAMKVPVLAFVSLQLVRLVFLILTGSSLPTDRQMNASLVSSNISCYIKIEYNLHVSLLIILLILEFVTIAYTIFFACHEKCVNRKLFNKFNVKRPSVTLTFFKFNVFVFSICVSIKTGCNLLSAFNVADVHSTFLNVNTIILVLGFPWLVLFYVQLTPIGYFVLIIQNMLMDLLKFGVIFVTFIETFALGFLHMLSSSGQDCTRGDPGFTSVMSSQYAIYSVMLNMIPMDVYGIEDDLSLKFLHVCFVLIVPIVLINFLVALFTSSVQRITEIKDLALCFQVYHVNLIPDYLFYLIAPNYYRKRQRLAFAHKDDSYYLVLTSAARPFNIKAVK